MTLRAISPAASTSQSDPPSACCEPVRILFVDRAETIAALAAIGWNRRFRRVSLDPARGLITLMSPSRLHEELATIFGDIPREIEGPQEAARDQEADATHR